MPETRYDPFTCDGIQAVTFHVPGWTLHDLPQVFDTAERAKRFVQTEMQYWVHYATRAEIVYYGYDPNVYNDPDDPSSGSFGTDGYPDAIATIDLDECEYVDDIPWERT